MDIIKQLMSFINDEKWLEIKKTMPCNSFATANVTHIISRYMDGHIINFYKIRDILRGKSVNTVTY